MPDRSEFTPKRTRSSEAIAHPARSLDVVSKLTISREPECSDGRFTDITDTLLPLFTDPDARGGRSWREVFGLERPLPRARGGAFIVREAVLASSDW